MGTAAEIDNEHTYILRQNMAVHYAAPFMFRLSGGSQAVLLDTGAPADPRFFPPRPTRKSRARPR